jgi:hypothetical protein
MQLRRFSLMLLAGGAIVAVLCARACADSGGRMPLFDWGIDENFDPDGPLDPALVFDRPKFTQSPVTVGRGAVQLETGYTYMYDDEDGVRVARHSFPDSMLRVGMFADWFELRAEWDYDIQRTKTGGAAIRDAGSGDINLGCKLYLTPQDCFLPETGLILESSVPAGDQPFSAGEVLPNIDYCYDWDLTGTDSWTVLGNTALGETTSRWTVDTYTRVAQSVALDHAWSDRIHSFLEFYMFAPVNASANHPEYYFDRGVSVFLSENIQWDVRAGMGLNKWADDFFAGTGLSVRYR